MSNYGIKIDLLKLTGAFVRNLTGKTATKRCIIIPVDDNDCMYLGTKGCYLGMSAFESPNNQYGDSHLIKPDIQKEVRERMTEEQRNAIPIIGNMRPIQAQGMTVSGSMSAENFEGDDDLPF